MNQKHEEVLSYLMYPQVFLDYRKAYEQFADVKVLDTPTFFNGMRLGETINVELEKGKILIIRLDEIGEADIEGNRTLFFNLNGQRREIVVKDNSIISSVQTKRKAEPTNKEQIGASMSGSVLEVLVKKRRPSGTWTDLDGHGSNEDGNFCRSSLLRCG